MNRFFQFGKTQSLLIQFILLSWLIVVIFPLGIAILNSLKPNLGQVIRDPFAMPDPVTTANYVKVWVESDFVNYFFNSAIIAFFSTLLTVFLSSSTAYVLARHKIPGKNFIFALFLIGVVIPMRLATPSIFVTVKTLGLLDSLVGVVLLQTAGMMPLAVFILTTFLKNIPPALEESAMIDGASPYRIYSLIVIPLVRPALATVALLTFIQAWNEYYWPLILLSSPEKFPLSIGITAFSGQYAILWHLMFSAIIIMLLPTVIAFLLASKHFISGLSMGGVKE